MAPADFAAEATKLQETLGREPSSQETVSSLLYPEVFGQFAQHTLEYVDTSCLPTSVFFYGLEPAEEVAVEIEKGKTLILKYMGVADPHPDGTRHVFFELNGIPRSVAVIDRSLESDIVKAEKEEAGNPDHLGAAMPGMVVSLAVQEGDSVNEGQKLLVIEAMKMQTTLVAEKKGKIQRILVKAGSRIETGDLLLVIE